MISISLGFRYVIANNSYKGHLSDLMINPMHPYNPNGAGNMVSAPLFFNTLSTAATGAATLIQPIIDGGGGGFTLDQLVGASFITQAEADQLAGGLGAAYNPAMTAADVQGAYYTNAAIMNGYSDMTSDKEVDAAQNGFGISPIIGVNFKFSDNLNVALKYEHKTEITLTNETVVDDVNLYPNGVKTPSDMPSLLSVGVGYKPMDKLLVSGGLHYYFDKGANYGKKIGGVFVDNDEVIDNNLIEAAIGLEYLVTDNILVSAGYLLTKTGVNDDYHSDLSHSLSTNSIGLGGKYILNDNIGINLGFMTTMYNGYTKSFTGYDETYNRKAMVIAVGLDYKF
jgi:long-subunit fatty acid transport protein